MKHDFGLVASFLISGQMILLGSLFWYFVNSKKNFFIPLLFAARSDRGQYQKDYQ